LTSDCYTEATMTSWKLPNIPTDSSFKYLISTTVCEGSIATSWRYAFCYILSYRIKGYYII